MGALDDPRHGPATWAVTQCEDVARSSHTRHEPAIVFIAIAFGEQASAAEPATDFWAHDEVTPCAGAHGRYMGTAR